MDDGSAKGLLNEGRAVSEKSNLFFMSALVTEDEQIATSELLVSRRASDELSQIEFHNKSLGPNGIYLRVQNRRM